MYIFKRIDETLIRWISDSDTQSSPSLSLIRSPSVNKSTTLIDIMNDEKHIEIKEKNRNICSDKSDTLIDIMNDEKHIEIKEKMRNICSDKGEICYSDSEIYYNSDSDIQPNFLTRERDVNYLKQKKKCCCCVIL